MRRVYYTCYGMLVGRSIYGIDVVVEIILCILRHRDNL